jgi:CheY-like chemotaxis protein
MAGHVASDGLIVVVEDDPDAREALTMLLEGEGYTVAAAAHGQEALELLANLPTPCLILLDLTMPVMDGWRFRAVQLANPHYSAIPVVVVTAADLSQHPPTGLTNVTVLTKPVEPDQLMALVKEHCG